MNLRQDTDRRVEQKLRDLIDRTARSRAIHSLVLAVETGDGAIGFRAAAGAAHPNDPYYIASITKMFTAAVVMQLVDEQRLSLDERMVDLLPDLDLAGVHRHRGVDHTASIELHHLLHQTSGLPDYFEGGFNEDFKLGHDRAYDLSEVLDIARSAEASFVPGDRGGRHSAYSDTNYQLLTAIIEASTGSTYGEAVEQRIIRPLGLVDTRVAGHDQTPHRRPLRLHHKGNAVKLPKALASEVGAGGIVSTLDDQLAFSRAYHDGRLFDRGNLADTQRWNRIFFPVDYGYGVMRCRLPRWMAGFRPVPELIGHSGSTNSFAFYAPDIDGHIVGTLNQMDNPARAFRLLPRIAAIVRDAA